MEGTLGEWTWCHCRVPLQFWLQGRVVTTNGRGAIDVVPLLGAIVGCHCSMLWLGEGDDQLWGSGIAGCHCRVPISVSYLPSIFRAANFTQTPRKQQWILSWASCRRYTVLYIDNTKTGFCYLGSMLGTISKEGHLPNMFLTSEKWTDQPHPNHIPTYRQLHWFCLVQRICFFWPVLT